MKHHFLLLILFPILLVLSACPIHAQAETPQAKTLIESGYTTDGIYYEAYLLPASDTTTGTNSAPGSIYREIELVYQGHITPAETYTHSELAYNIIYSGVLKRSLYQWRSDDTTHAFYQGYIYPTS